MKVIDIEYKRVIFRLSFSLKLWGSEKPNYTTYDLAMVRFSKSDKSALLSLVFLPINLIVGVRYKK